MYVTSSVSLAFVGLVCSFFLHKKLFRTERQGLALQLLVWWDAVLPRLGENGAGSSRPRLGGCRGPVILAAGLPLPRHSSPASREQSCFLPSSPRSVTLRVYLEKPTAKLRRVVLCCKGKKLKSSEQSVTSLEKKKPKASNFALCSRVHWLLLLQRRMGTDFSTIK